MDKKKDEYDDYVGSDAQTTDPNYEATVRAKRANLDTARDNYHDRQQEYSSANQNYDEKMKKYEIDQAKKDTLRADADAKKQKLEDASKNPESNPESSETKRDLRWNRTLLTMRLCYKTAKILCLTVMETLENTEFLARCLIEDENIIREQIYRMGVGVSNANLKMDRRDAIDKIMNAIQTLEKEEKEKADKATELLKNQAEELLKKKEFQIQEKV
jgi:hypothetical protein